MSGFVEVYSAPPLICPTAFKCITEREPFESWKSGKCAWQMRIVGGPGTGKTTISTKIVELLTQHHGDNVPVAAIFMKGKSERSPENFVISILESIHGQLAAKLSGPIDFVLQDSEGGILHPRDFEGLRRSIYTILRNLSCAFLILDDLDQCGYQTVQLLEEEFIGLQDHGLRIMTTSRVARYAKQYWYCTLGDGHLITADCDLWLCTECYQQAERLNEEEREEMLDNSILMCTSCKEEAGDVAVICCRGHEFPSLCRPFNYAQLDLGEMLSKEWDNNVSDFGLWILQNEHGNILPWKTNISWPGNVWPPLTPIGEILTANMGLMDSTMIKAEGNLTLAKLRLEEICEADKLDHFGQVRDRLPRKIVSLFDALIASVKSQGPIVSALGMSAIKLATKQPDGVSFEDLRDTLQASQQQIDLGSLNVQEILHAARGLLNVKWYAGVDQLEAYHIDFFLYASQRYNEYLENYQV